MTKRLLSLFLILSSIGLNAMNDDLKNKKASYWYRITYFVKSKTDSYTHYEFNYRSNNDLTALSNKLDTETGVKLLNELNKEALGFVKSIYKKDTPENELVKNIFAIRNFKDQIKCLPIKKEKAYKLIGPFISTIHPNLNQENLDVNHIFDFEALRKTKEKYTRNSEFIANNRVSWTDKIMGIWPIYSNFAQTNSHKKKGLLPEKEINFFDLDDGYDFSKPLKSLADKPWYKNIFDKSVNAHNINAGELIKQTKIVDDQKTIRMIGSQQGRVVWNEMEPFKAARIDHRGKTIYHLETTDSKFVSKELWQI